METKTTRSISVDLQTWEKFIAITSAQKISASNLLQEYINKYVEKNEEIARKSIAEFWGFDITK